MSTNHTTCPFCDKDVSWSSFNKHIFSRAHMVEHVIPALKKAKENHKRWREATKQSNCPCLFVKDNTAQVHICFGCKKAKTFLPSYHLRECKDAQTHIDTLKELIGEPVEGEVVVDADVVALKREIEKLKRQVKAEKDLCSTATDQTEEYRVFNERYFGVDIFDITDGQREKLLEEGYRGSVSFKKEEEQEEW